MKNPTFPKVNLNYTALSKALLLLASIAVAGFGVVPLLRIHSQENLETLARPAADPNWLLTKQPSGLGVSLQQSDLFAEEIYKSLIQSEAARIVSKAHEMQSSPRYADCYGKPIESCFDSIEQSIREEWLKAVTHDDKARVLFRWRSLQVARAGNVEPPAMSPDGTFLQLSDKLALERRYAMDTSIEGASRTMQIETQLQRIQQQNQDAPASPVPASPAQPQPEPAPPSSPKTTPSPRSESGSSTGAGSGANSESSPPDDSKADDAKTAPTAKPALESDAESDAELEPKSGAESGAESESKSGAKSSAEFSTESSAAKPPGISQSTSQATSHTLPQVNPQTTSQTTPQGASIEPSLGASTSPRPYLSSPTKQEEGNEG